MIYSISSFKSLLHFNLSILTYGYKTNLDSIENLNIQRILQFYSYRNTFAVRYIVLLTSIIEWRKLLIHVKLVPEYTFPPLPHLLFLAARTPLFVDASYLLHKMVGHRAPIHLQLRIYLCDLLPLRRLIANIFWIFCFPSKRRVT